jgi:glycosyltransferase involved in cell wall biosynthesis
MLFSVLMANYNNSRYLNNALKSVLKQTYTNWEVILVDDGSTDEFETVIKPYLNDKRIKIFRLGLNRGCAYAKYFCAKKATGEVLAFLDVDDMLDPSALRIMVDAHIQHSNSSIIHSTHYICDQHLNVVRINASPRSLPSNTPYLLLADASIHHFATFKKSAYDKTTGIDPVKEKDKVGDQELYYLLEEQGSVNFVNQPLYYYRIHPGSISNWGNEAIATLQHYAVIEESCKRRIKKLKTSKESDAVQWIKKYRTKYYKVRIMNSFRRKQWVRFFISLIIFPFAGGMENIVSYCRKLPKEGFALIRRTFFSSYQILND